MTDLFSASWLQNLPADARQRLRKVCTAVDFPRGGFVYRFGAEQDRLWAVQGGQVRVLVSTNEMHPVLGHIHGPGAWFGEVEFSLSVAAYVEMEAVAGTRLFRISRQAFERVADRHPQVWESVARLASMNLWYATSTANDLALRTSKKRVAAALLRLSGHRAAIQGNPPLERISARQQEVADLANVARTTASKILSEFRDRRIIELEYGSITVAAPSKLSGVLQDPQQ
jgi:CRP-like cAMP-binding protein